MASIYAYYAWPPVWVGTGVSAGVLDFDVRILSEEAYREELPAGVLVRCLRGGMFIFDFSKWPRGMDQPEGEPWERKAQLALSSRRIAVFNTHLAALNTALSRRQQTHHPMTLVTPKEVIRVKSFEGIEMGFRDQRISELVSAQFPSTYNPNRPTTFDWRIAGRTTTVELETVKVSLELLSTVLNHPNPDALVLTDLHARGCEAFAESNFNLCLTISWTITERLMSTLWKRYIDENRVRSIDASEVSFINSDRKDFLFGDHRSFSASVVAEILSLTETLPFPIYQDLTNARKARNDWLHKLKPVAWDDALLSIKLAEKMLRLVERLDFGVSNSFSF